jgi:hypothetical protein
VAEGVGKQALQSLEVVVVVFGTNRFVEPVVVKASTKDAHTLGFGAQGYVGYPTALSIHASRGQARVSE